MDIRIFKDKLFEKAKEYGFTEYEIYYDASKIFEIRVFQKEISQYKNASLNGVSFRGKINGKMGYSYSERIDDEIISLLLDSAKMNAEIMEDIDEMIYSGKDEYRKTEGISSNIYLPDANKKIEWAKQMEEIALKESEKVDGVEYSVVSNITGENYIANSYGIDLSQERGFAIAYVVVRAKEGEDIKSGYEMYKGKDFDLFNPEVIAKKAVNKTLEALGAEPVKSKKYNIILKNEMVADLFDVFIQAFYGESIQKGFSLLKDKVGERIASEIVTIKDVSRHENSLVPLSFDSEGVSVKDKILVENGILKGYLYNLKSAMKEGVEPTGNGFKSSYKGAVTTSYANLYIEPSNTSYDELIKKLGDGLIINDLAGLHSGANPISGDFSLLAEGFLVEGGKIVKPVEQITVASNFFELLKNIEVIGSDLRFEMGSTGCIGMPSLLIKDISVAGE